MQFKPSTKEPIVKPGAADYRYDCEVSAEKPTYPAFTMPPV